MSNLSELTLRDCVIGEIELGDDATEARLPRFERCLIGRLNGRVGRSDVPASFDSGTNVELFGGGVETTSQILALPISTPRRVLLTLVRKLFMLRGGGRRESALLRGLPSAQRALVPQLIAILHRHGAILRSKTGESVIFGFPCVTHRSE